MHCSWRINDTVALKKFLVMCGDTVQFCNMLTVTYEVCSESNVQGKITLVRCMLKRWRKKNILETAILCQSALETATPLHQEL